MERQPLLDIKNLSVTFVGHPPFAAVRNLSLRLFKGETLAVVGESGSGKSLTAQAIMGLLPKGASTEGEIILHTDAGPVCLTGLQNAKSWQKMRGRDLAIVFQEPMSALNPIMTVGRQVAEALRVHQSLSRHDAKRITIEWLGKVQLPKPESMFDRYPHQLSGGQKQRVMIAMAMCNHPAVLIADEPATALDTTVQQEIVKLIAWLQDLHHTAMLFITHDLALAEEIADEIMVMQRGQLVEYGSSEQIMHHAAQPYTRALLASRPNIENKGSRLQTVGDFLNPDSEHPIQEVIAVPRSAPPASTAAPVPLLSVRELSVSFAASNSFLMRGGTLFKAVDDVSFTVLAGETLGLVGESGCGKSTVSKALMGLVPSASGNIIYKGQHLEVLSERAWRKVRRSIQMIFQDPYSSLNPRLTIGQALMEPMRVHQIVPAAQLESEAGRLLDIVGMPRNAAIRYPHQFSGGQRQRIGIARALALRPQLIICDESVSALDVSIQAQILNLLKDLQVEMQLTYIFISHDLAVVYHMSDRVLVMRSGKVIESGGAEQVLRHPQDPYTQKLVSAVGNLNGADMS